MLVTRSDERLSATEIEDWNINVTLSKPELAAMDYGQELFAMLASDGNIGREPRNVFGIDGIFEDQQLLDRMGQPSKSIAFVNESGQLSELEFIIKRY